MNKEQMDEFLQSIGGLKNGFKLESNPITDSDFFEVERFGTCVPDICTLFLWPAISNRQGRNGKGGKEEKDSGMMSVLK